MRNSSVRGLHLRLLLRNKSSVPFPLLFRPNIEAQVSSSHRAILSSAPIPSKLFYGSTASAAAATLSPSSHHFHNRALFSSSSGPSNLVLVKNEEEFNSSLHKVQEKSLPAIFYFTAVWCGPCRLISPVIEELSKKNPHVTTYKIDIDQEGLGSILNGLNITSVPTLHFFQNGKKVSEMIGADVARLKDTAEKLYKQE